MPNAASVILTLQSQAAPQINATVSAYQQLSVAEQKAAQSAATYAKTQAQVALADSKTVVEEQRLAVQTANAAKAQDQASLAALRLANAQQKATSGNTFATQTADALKSGLLSIVGPAALVAAGFQAIRAAADLTVAGETTNRVARSFESLSRQAGTTGDVMLAALRKASGGEISDLNLQLATDKGLLLGVASNAQQFADIMAIARDRAAKMGITTTQAFDDITTGIGRESPRILDNLGIIVDADAAHKAYADSIGKSVDQLSKAERIEALRNAVVAQGRGTLDAATTATNDQTNAYARLGVAIENARNRLGSYLATDTQRTASAAAAIISIDGTTASYGRAGVALAAASGDLARYLNLLNPVNAVTGAVSATNAAAITTFNQLAGTALPQNILSINGLTNAWNTLTGATATNVPATQHASAAYDAQLAAIRGNIGASETYGNVLSDETQKKLDSQIATAQVAQEQRQLDADSQRAAQGLLGAGDQALLLARKYKIATSQAQDLINAQQRLSNATALADQRVGERDPNNTQTAAEFNAFDKLADAGRAAQAAKDKAASEKAAADAKRLRDAQDALNLSRAKTSAQKIAELQRQQATTSDPAEKLQLQAQIEQERNSAAKSHTSELNKQLKLNESTYDSIEKQKQATIDLAVARAQNTLSTLKDQDELKKANAILNSSGASENLKARAQAKRDLILAEENKRDFEIAQKQATERGTIINGKLFQSVPGSGGPLPSPPTSPKSSTGSAAAQAPGSAPSSPANGMLAVNVIIDGKVAWSGLAPYAWAELDGAIQHARTQQGT